MAIQDHDWLSVILTEIAAWALLYWWGGGRLKLLAEATSGKAVFINTGGPGSPNNFIPGIEGNYSSKQAAQSELASLIAQYGGSAPGTQTTIKNWTVVQNSDGTWGIQTTPTS